MNNGENHQIEEYIIQRRNILKNTIPEITQNIEKNIYSFISDEGMIDKLDYRNGEKYSIANWYYKKVNGKRYRVLYRLFVTIEDK